jgi:hypothetical protein
MSQHPFRDPNEAAVARLHELERELARARSELSRHRRAPWKRGVRAAMVAFLTLLFLSATAAAALKGCSGFTMG